MNTELARRSACDRCRGQKLRCVRPTKSGDGPSPDERQLETCERCLKAKADCINTLSPYRKPMRDKRPHTLSSPTLSSSHEWTSTLPLGSKDMDAHHATIKERENKERSLSTSETTSVQPINRTFQDRFDSRPIKRRLIEPFPSQPANINSDQVRHSSPTFNRHTENRDEWSTNHTNVLSISTDDTPTLIPNRPSNIDSAGFGTGLNAEYRPPHENSTTFMDMLLVPDSRNKAEPSGNLLAKTSVGSSIHTSDLAGSGRQNCLHRMSELSSRMLKEFSRINSLNLSDLLSAFPSPTSILNASNAPSSGAENSPRSLANAIGRALDNSQTFLAILQDFKGSVVPHGSGSSKSSPDSVCSYSEYWEEHDSFLSFANDHSDLPDVMDLTSGDTSQPSTENANSEERIGLPDTIDMPTTLMILTCYTWLLQTYDTIFSRIQSSLSQSEITVPLKSMPSILPGIYVGGFDLDGHKDLQIEILIQISLRMLERIEQTLGINVIMKQPLDATAGSTLTSSGQGILDTAPASAMLEIMFKQNELGYAKGEGGKIPLVRQTMDSIRNLLRRSRL